MLTTTAALVALACTSAGAAPTPAATAPTTTAPDARALVRAEARYAPVDLRVDVSRLPGSEQRALARLVQAAWVVDGLFLRQVWGGNEAVLLSLLDDPTRRGRARLASFLRNKGPWDELDGNRPFLPDVPPRPPGAGFYPADATRDEIQRFLDQLPEADRARASGFFSVLRRDGAGKLTIVPYSVAYQPELGRAAELLREAARLTADPGLRAFLEQRATAFGTDDYYASDVAWLELESAVEPTIGPYDTYEDRWFSAKAAFQAVIAVRDEEESRRLKRFAAELQDVEDHLPIAPEFRTPRLGALAPISVVNEVFAAGDARHGVAPAAFNLPDDEHTVREKGSKRVMLKNVQRAKFEQVLLPVARGVLGAGDRVHVGFEAFFTQILAHELMHGLGPQRVLAPGAAQGTAVRLALAEASPAIEEAKADVAGLFAVQRFIDRGVLPRALEDAVYPTFVAGLFRSLQFGVEEAHGRGVALQMSWFLDHGAVRPGRDGTFTLDRERLEEAIASLTSELMTIQARGDVAAARDLLRRLAVIRPEVARALGRVRGVPVDIAPRFVTADELVRKYGG